MTGKIKLNHSGGNGVSLNAPANNPSISDVAFKLPQADGSNGQFMKTDGSGNLAFASVADTNDFVKLDVATGAGGTGDLIFDNLDVATYKTFDFTLMCQPSTDAQQLRFRYRTGGASGSTVTDQHHQVAYLYMYNSNNIGVNTNMGVNSMILTQGVGGGNSQEGLSLNMRISMGDSNDNGVTRQRMNTVWWSVMVHNESLMPEWHVGNGTLTEGGGAGGVGSFPTGFVLDFTSGNVGNFSYQLYGLKR